MKLVAIFLLTIGASFAQGRLDQEEESPKPAEPLPGCVLFETQEECDARKVREDRARQVKEMRERLEKVEDPHGARVFCKLPLENWAEAFDKVAQDLDTAKEKCLLEDAKADLAARKLEGAAKKDRLKAALDKLKAQSCTSLTGFSRISCEVMKEERGL